MKSAVGTVYGGDGNDSLFGGTLLAVNLFGGDGDDSLVGGVGATVGGVLSGGAGNDTIVALGTASDSVFGGDGNDLITGGGSHTVADVISGGEGNDTILGDGTTFGGNDTLVGGDGNDRFLLGNIVAANSAEVLAGAASLFDLISGFQDGSDKIQLLTGIIAGGASPSLATGASLGGTNSIVYQTSGTELIVYINGSAADQYLAIRVSGVSTLDINDFEFLS
ncbi:MAG: hypothetical protein ACMVO3_06340 [Thalassobaculum sp.]